LSGKKAKETFKPGQFIALGQGGLAKHSRESATGTVQREVEENNDSKPQRRELGRRRRELWSRWKGGVSTSEKKQRKNKNKDELLRLNSEGDDVSRREVCGRGLGPARRGRLTLGGNRSNGAITTTGGTEGRATLFTETRVGKQGGRELRPHDLA